MKPEIKCKNCIFWIEKMIIKNHVGVCARYPELKDFNTLISKNVCLSHCYSEEDHWCGEFIHREHPKKTFKKML